MKAKGVLLEYELGPGVVKLQLMSDYRRAFGAHWIKHRRAVHEFDFTKWYKKKSTGPNSTNNHVMGHSRTIADEIGEDVRWVRDEACIRTEGFPVKTNKFGKIRPAIDWADINSKLASDVVETLHRMAAWLNIKLIENEWGTE